MDKKDKGMKPVLIYGGTTEGRKLAEQLCKAGLLCTVCVATEYGETVMEKIPGLQLRQGRMDAAQMEELAASEDFLAVIDATHPFAEEVSQNISKSVESRSIPYIRLKRNTGFHNREDGNMRFQDMESCAEALKQTKGNILLATGSKELKVFCMDELKERLFVRVLPSIESLLLCEKQGIGGRQIIAMQGPFSVEMNEAVIREFRINILVTKESGAAGGYYEKLRAAHNSGIKAYIIRNPEKEIQGLSFEETLDKLYALSGTPALKTKRQISLIGMGMGREGLLTLEAKEALEQAEAVFGAERLLTGISEEKEKYPIYKPEDILSVIAANYSEGRETIKIAVLFSGDTGFYSGAEKLYRRLREESEELNCEVRIFPGISAMSYLAAAGGISLNDAAVISIHGRKADVVKTVSEQKKTFLLVSGAEDLRKLCELFLEKGLASLSLLVGYQLSYPEEEIRRMTVEEGKTLYKEGLYCCFIENMKSIGAKPADGLELSHKLSHGRKDNCFIRNNSPFGKVPIGNVPMTKEEIREVSICKLDLRKGAVLYDIGSGTGSVAVECALLSEDILVYAIEKNKEAAGLIRENCGKFGVSNVKVICANAPEGLAALPMPTHVFIGGSGGNSREILRVLYEKNPCLKVVMNAVTLETIGSMANLLKEFPVEGEEVVQIQVSRSKQAGAYHLMQAENAVFILSFCFSPYVQKIRFSGQGV